MICGKVLELHHTYFVVSTKKGLLNCRSPSQEYIRKNDDILLSGSDENGTFILNRPPCIIPDEETIADLLTEKGLPTEYDIETLNEASRNRITRRESGIPKQLLNFWIKEFITRPLQCLGLSLKEIMSSPDLIEVHNTIREDPFRILTIPVEKAAEIARFFKVKNLHRRQEVGTYARELRVYLLKNRKAYHTAIQFVEELKEYGTECFDGFWALPEVTRAETMVAERIKRLLEIPCAYQVLPFSNELLDESQKKAIVLALSNSVSIINGRPGTGKTSVLAEICLQLHNNSLSFCCLAFTARAVNRMREILGKACKAMTIHMFLARQEEPPNNIIIDEAAMVSTELLSLLIESLPETTKLLFVGDDRQLQPIDWGNPFSCLLSSSVPRVTLQFNHRQKTKGQALINNIETLWQWQTEEDIPEHFAYQVDESFHFETDLENALRNLLPYPQGRVITYRNREVRQLTDKLQEIRRAEHCSVTDDEGITWYIGQPVYLTKNCYCRNLFNGSEGIVEEISPDHITVNWKPPRTYRYELKRLCDYKVNVLWFSEDGGELESEGSADIKLGKLYTSAEQDMKSAKLLTVKKEIEFLRSIRTLSERAKHKNQLIDAVESLRDLFDREFEKKRINDCLSMLISVEAVTLKRIENILLQLEGQISTSQLVSAEVLTIHRMQGEETQQVIFVIPSGASSRIVDRNAVFTACSRAKQEVILFGGSPDMGYGRTINVPEKQFLTERINE
jgi:hypothetical protein